MIEEVDEATPLFDLGENPNGIRWDEFTVNVRDGGLYVRCLWAADTEHDLRLTVENQWGGRLLQYTHLGEGSWMCVVGPKR